MFASQIKPFTPWESQVQMQGESGAVYSMESDGWLRANSFSYSYASGSQGKRTWAGPGCMPSHWAGKNVFSGCIFDGFQWNDLWEDEKGLFCYSSGLWEFGKSCWAFLQTGFSCTNLQSHAVHCYGFFKYTVIPPLSREKEPRRCTTITQESPLCPGNWSNFLPEAEPLRGPTGRTSLATE